MSSPKYRPVHTTMDKVRVRDLVYLAADGSRRWCEVFGTYAAASPARVILSLDHCVTERVRTTAVEVLRPRRSR